MLGREGSRETEIEVKLPGPSDNGEMGWLFAEECTSNYNLASVHMLPHLCPTASGLLALQAPAARNKESSRKEWRTRET